MFQTVKVAAISIVPKKLGIAANADKMEENFRRAAKEGVELAVAPEGMLEGYVVNELILGKIPVERMLEVAVTIRSSYILRFRALAKELRICLAFGLAERIGDEVFNCAVYLDQRGEICGKYHKMQFAEGYHPSWWFNRLGKTSRAISTPFGRCGFLICNDRWNADIARIPVLDGAQYLIIPSYGDTTSAQDKAVLSRARENGVPIIEANVGRCLIISRGEIVAASSKKNDMVVGTIDIPARPSTPNRDLQEKEFLTWRAKEMPKRYRQKMKEIQEERKGIKESDYYSAPSHNEKGAIVKKRK